MIDNNLALVLLVLYYCDGKINGRKRFQKIICILKHRYNIPFNFDFIPYYYGPFSEDLSNSLDTLVGSGIIKEQKNTISDNITQFNYELTDQGNKMTKGLIEKSGSSGPIIKKINMAVTELKNMETPALVHLSKQVFSV
jgi:uncharacterized protein YwgA